MSLYPGIQNQQYSFAQLEQLWLANGGQQSLAPVMAAIALAESGGNSASLNNNPGTGDYSVGLWQINYYGSLFGPRSQTYGAPQQLASDPNAQARAAVTLAAGGAGLNNWTTYSHGTYRQYLSGANTPGQVASLAATGGGIVQPQSAQTASFNIPNPWDPLSWFGGGSPVSTGNALLQSFQDIAKFFRILTDPTMPLRAMEVLAGGILVAIGGAMYVQILVPSVGGIIATVAGGPGGAISQVGQTRRARFESQERTKRQATSDYYGTLARGEEARQKSYRAQVGQIGAERRTHVSEKGKTKREKVSERGQTRREHVRQEGLLQRQQERAAESRYRAASKGTSHRGPGDRSRGYDRRTSPAEEYFF